MLPLLSAGISVPEPSPLQIPRYVGLGRGHGTLGFLLALYPSPKSWHNQSENHEVVV